MTDKYKTMSDQDLFALIEKKTKEEPAKEENKDAAVGKDAEAKAIEKIVAMRIFDRISGSYPTYPYGYYPYYYPYPEDVARHAAAVAAYHDIIARAEAVNAIAGMVAPSADVALKLLEGIKEPKKEEKPPAKAFVQTEEQGVPVTIEPTLLTNECPTCDLKQKDYIIDGVNGIDFVQTKAEGVPVFVEPTLLVNEMAAVDLKQKDIIIDGVDGFDYVQLDS